MFLNIYKFENNMEKLSDKEASEIQNYLASFNKEIECDELESEAENGQESDGGCGSTKEFYAYTSGDELDDENPGEIKIKSEDEDPEFYCNAYSSPVQNGSNYTKISPSSKRRKAAEIIRLGPKKEPNSNDGDSANNGEALVPIVEELQLDDHRTLEMVAQFAEQAVKMTNDNDVMGSLGAYQTVTVVPSDTNPGELSYVLFVSEEGTCLGKDSNDMNVALYDLNGNEPFSDTFLSKQVAAERGKVRTVRLTTRRHPIGAQTHVCTFCSYTSNKRYLLSRHMKSHSDERPHKCGVCERGFKTLASLQNHVNTHTGTRPHPCKECDSCFTTSGELVRHVRYKHTHEKPHKCTECDYASVELSKLKRHMRCHTGERPYQCPHCTYASPDTYKLKRHLRIHTGEKPYECDICQTRFTQSNSLKAHKLIHSGNKPVFHCEYCPATCGRKTDLRIHMEKLHSSDNPHRCNRCGKVFLDRYSYKIHVKSHEGEKCFKCDLCNYASISQRHLETHMFVHTDQKPFHCDECDQSFRQKQLLKRHKNIYHDPNYVRPEPKAKPHVCVMCSKAFRHRGNLIRHFALHDPDATAMEKEAAMHLGEPNSPGEDDDGEEDNYYLRDSDKQDQQVVVFEVIQLPSANNVSSDEQTVTMVDGNTLLLNTGDTQSYSIIEQADDSVNNFLSFGESVSDPEDVENISSVTSGNINKIGSGCKNKLNNYARRKQNSQTKSTLGRRPPNKKPRILKLYADKDRLSNDQAIVIHHLDIPDEATVLQREKELEQAKELQVQKDFEECFGFDMQNFVGGLSSFGKMEQIPRDKDEEEDLLSMSCSGYQSFHSSLVQDIS